MPQKPVFYFVDPSLSRQIHKAHTFPDRFGFYQRGIHLFPVCPVSSLVSAWISNRICSITYPVSSILTPPSPYKKV